jgi:hypothetical protein
VIQSLVVLTTVEAGTAVADHFFLNDMASYGLVGVDRFHRVLADQFLRPNLTGFGSGL